MWVGFYAVVVHLQFRDFRHQLNQIDSTLVVALTNPRLRDIVSASSNPRSNACDVQLGTAQSHEPDANVDSYCQRLLEKSRYGVSTQGCFEREVQPFGNRSFQKTFSLLPSGAVRFSDRNARIGGPNSGGRFVRIEVICAGSPEHRPGDSALARPVRSSEHIDARTITRARHAFAQLLLPPSPVPSPRQQTLFSCPGALLLSASAREARRIRG